MNWWGTIGDIFLAYGSLFVVSAKHLPWGLLGIVALLMPFWGPFAFYFVFIRPGNASDARPPYSPGHWNKS